MDLNAFGLLIMRLGFGLSLSLLHGLPKLLDFTNKMHVFPDPFHIGSAFSLSLALAAELICAFLVALGLFTRFAAIPVIILTGVAFFVIHATDPMVKKELALLYLAAFSAIFACGPGAYSADALFRRTR